MKYKPWRRNMFAMEMKFIAKDFDNETLPKVGEIGIVKEFFGGKNVPVIITEGLWQLCS